MDMTSTAPPSHAPELWLPIRGYEADYEISNHGRIRSVKRKDRPPLIMSQSEAGPTRVYRKVNLWKDGKGVSKNIHTLVATHFIGECPPGHEVAHDDGVGHHNWMENLFWKTRKENHADKRRHGTNQIGENNPATSLSRSEAEAILSSDRGTRELAALYGVSRETIRRIKKRIHWPHIGEKRA